MAEKRLAVVGAGVFGSWIALLAVRAGFETILIDQYGPGNSLSSSGGSSRIMRRAYGPDEVYSLFAERSRELWAAFFDEENRSDCFRRTGVLWMADRGEQSIHAARRILERHKLAHEFMDDVQAIRRFCPQINVAAGAVALFEPDCGALLAETSVRAVAEAAIRHGAKYRDLLVQAPLLNRSMTSLAVANGEPIEADIFVFACGSWLGKLFPEVLGGTIFPTRQEVFFFSPQGEGAAVDSSSLPVWVDQTDPRIPYGFPDINAAGIKIAFHRLGSPFDPDSVGREVREEQIKEASEYLRSLLPQMGTPTLLHAQLCHYENTSNGDFLIDRHPSMGNVWFAGGGSGHGFKHGPAVAEYLLEAIRKDHSPEPRFRLAGKGRTLAKSVV